MENTENKIRQIITDTLGLPENMLTTNTNFKTDFNVDSLDIVEVMVAIEKEFNISIPDEQLERIHTVQQVTDYVNKTARFALA